MRKQRGVSLVNLIVLCALVLFVGIMAMKLIPPYIEYFKVKKLFSAMEQAGDLKGSVRDIRKSYETRNAIEDVKSVKGEDLEVTKEGGEAILSATWSVKVPMVSNISSCIDFYVTTAK